MSEKIKIEILSSTFNKIKEQFEAGIESYQKLGITNVDQFVSYILENFANSTSQFEKLSEQMKKMIENIDIENLSFEDIFKNIATSSQKKTNPSGEHNNQNSNNHNHDLDKKDPTKKS